MTKRRPSWPDEVKVGPHRYSLSFDKVDMNAACRANQSDLLGFCDRRLLSILIDPDQAPDQLADTAVHESLHAITQVTALADEWGKEREEEVVSRLAPAVLSWIRDNPDLIANLAHQ